MTLVTFSVIIFYIFAAGLEVKCVIWMKGMKRASSGTQIKRDNAQSLKQRKKKKMENELNHAIQQIDSIIKRYES